MSSNNFARLCEVENSSAPFSPSWSISHDCAKFSHGHAKSVFTFPLWAAAKILLGSFHTSVQIFRMFMRNEKNIVFQLLLPFLPFLPFLSLDSTSTTSKSTPNPNTNRLHCFFHYAFGSSSTLLVLFNLIHLFCHQFIKIIPWNNSKTS